MDTTNGGDTPKGSTAGGENSHPSSQICCPSTFSWISSKARVPTKGEAYLKLLIQVVIKDGIRVRSFQFEP
jgi:hypothetical protein